MKRIIALVCIIFASPALSTEKIELVGASSKYDRYCIDMRTLSELEAAPAITSTSALNKLFDCKKTFVLPLPEAASPDEINRYSKVMEQFEGHWVLLWSTVGTRSEVMKNELEKIDIKVKTIIGGTYYLGDALGG